MKIESQNEKIRIGINLIQEIHRRRVSWHKVEKGLTLQGKAICRRLADGDKDAGSKLFDSVAKLKPDQMMALVESRDDLPDFIDPDIILAVTEVHPIARARRLVRHDREILEGELESLAKDLPIARWIETIPGVSYGSLAGIIGSTGDLYNYPTVQKLWKRMGLAVMSNGRQRQMRDAEQAKIHGYNPPRRSSMWVVGTSILRTQSEKLDKETGEVLKEAGDYRKLYDERRAYEKERNENGDYAEQAAKRLNEANFGKTTTAFKAYSAGKLPALHLHARAQRYVEKRFLRDLWVQWRKIMPAPEKQEVAPIS